MHWMRSLADHYAQMRRAHPNQPLLVAFDIDGTILDMRHMVCQVLLAYDRTHGTTYFVGLRPDDVDVHENQVDRWLEGRSLPRPVRRHILDWYLEKRWEPAAVLEAHRPFQGVLEVIRWFQLQPDTYVGLDTGRPESLRAETLRSLNTLGAEYRVSFDDRLLRMNPGGWNDDVAASKVAGLRSFQDDGYLVVAVVDNEPENIAALAAADDSGGILFLHARTLYESRRAPTPRTVEGSAYELRSLIGEHDLPQHIQLVWHGVNDDANLRQFLASPIRWGEVDVRLSAHDELLLQHDPGEPAAGAGARRLLLTDGLEAFGHGGKAVKLDLKHEDAIEPTLTQVAECGLDDEDLWFNGRIDVLGEDGIRRIVAAHPGAVVQCPVDFLGPLAVAASSQAKLLVEMLTGWGLNRFSVGWSNPHVRTLLDRFDAWGHDVNIYAVPDLEQFLRAALLLPRSITADFNFPEWHYFGRGSGHGGRYHRYGLVAASEDPSLDVA